MGLFRFLLLIGFVAAYWPAILATLAVACAAYVVWSVQYASCTDRKQRRRQDAAVVARADEQHEQTLAGDERGLYGAYTPAGL